MGLATPLNRSAIEQQTRCRVKTLIASLAVLSTSASVFLIGSALFNQHVLDANQDCWVSESWLDWLPNDCVGMSEALFFPLSLLLILPLWRAFRALSALLSVIILAIAIGAAYYAVEHLDLKRWSWPDRDDIRDAAGDMLDKLPSLD